MIERLLKAQSVSMAEAIKSLHGASRRVQRDVDGAPIHADELVDSIMGGSSLDDNDDNESLDVLRQECWRSYNASPFVQTAVSDFVDSIVGDGFEISSEKPRIRNLINLYETDFRNKLYLRYKQFMMHYRIEGEKYTSFSVHPKSKQPFIEIDHISPSSVEKIYFYPNKTHLPILYKIKNNTGNLNDEFVYLPSINLAYQPSLIDKMSSEMKRDGIKKTDIAGRSSGAEFKKVGGFTQFIADWEGEILVSRPRSRLRTIVVWNNLYTLMKLTEVEQKRALSAYVWAVESESEDAFQKLYQISQDKDLSKMSGLFDEVTPGSRLFLPAGVKLVASSPKLPAISGQDSDLLQGVVSGLNQPSHDVTGDATGTFASAKATKAAVVDRVKHFQSWAEKLYRYEFWKPILFLQHAVYGFPLQFTENEVVDFKEKKPIVKKNKYNSWDSLAFNFPINENYDFKGNSTFVMGNKHPGVVHGFGSSSKSASRRIGIGNYSAERRMKATEDLKYPDLYSPIDRETNQEFMLAKNTEENNNGEE